MTHLSPYIERNAIENNHTILLQTQPPMDLRQPSVTARNHLMRIHDIAAVILILIFGACRFGPSAMKTPHAPQRASLAPAYDKV